MKALTIAFFRVKSWSRDYKVWAAFLLGFALCILNISKYIAFSEAVSSPVQAVEAYIIVGSTVPYFTGILLGALLLLSDAPFTSSRSPYEMLRVGRKQWLSGQVCYVFLASIIYSLAILLFSVIVCALSTDVNFSEKWSSSMMMLAERRPSFAVEVYKLAFPYPEFIHATTPYIAMVLTLFFNGCYITFICMCMLAINIRFNRNIGWVVAAVIHIAGYVIYANGPLVFRQYLSLLCCSIPAYHYIKLYNISSLYTAFVLVALLSLLAYFVRKSAGKFEPFR